MNVALLNILSQVVNPREVIQNQFNKQPGDPGTWNGIVLLIVGIAVFLFALRIIRLYEQRTRDPEQIRCPGKLFREVLKSLDLGFRKRELLARMARELGVSSPTQLLLSPEQFDQACRRWLDLGGPHPKQHEAELREISEAVFCARETASGS